MGGAGTSGDVVHDSLYVEVKHLKQAAIFTLWNSVRPKAKRERKDPIIVMHQKGAAEKLAVIDFEWLLWLLNGQECAKYRCDSRTLRKRIAGK